MPRAVRSALRLDPAYSLAHNNLEPSSGAGRVDEARREYEPRASGAQRRSAQQPGAALLASNQAAAAFPLTRPSRAPIYPEGTSIWRALRNPPSIRAAIRAAPPDTQAAIAGKTICSRAFAAAADYRAGSDDSDARSRRTAHGDGIPTASRRSDLRGSAKADGLADHGRESLAQRSFGALKRVALRDDARRSRSEHRHGAARRSRASKASCDARRVLRSKKAVPRQVVVAEAEVASPRAISAGRRRRSTPPVTLEAQATVNSRYAGIRVRRLLHLSKKK